MSGLKGFSFTSGFSAVQLFLDSDHFGSVSKNVDMSRQPCLYDRPSKVERTSAGCHSLLRHTQSPHLDQVLCNLGDSLLAFMCDEVGPVDEFLVDL